MLLSQHQLWVDFILLIHACNKYLCMRVYTYHFDTWREKSNLQKHAIWSYKNNLFLAINMMDKWFWRIAVRLTFMEDPTAVLLRIFTFKLWRQTIRVMYSNMLHHNIASSNLPYPSYLWNTYDRKTKSA